MSVKYKKNAGKNQVNYLTNPIMWFIYFVLILYIALSSVYLIIMIISVLKFKK